MTMEELMRTWIVPFIIAAGLIAPRLSRAQQPAVETAETLFNRGQEHAKRGEYRAACPLFAESLRLDNQVGTLLNLAGCEERIGALVKALAHWREAIEKLSGPNGDPKFLEFAKKRADELDPRVPRLTIRLALSAPPGTRVVRDGEELASAALGVPMPVDPGSIELVVLAQGRQERREKVVVVEGERKEITVDAGALSAAPPPLAPVVPVMPPVPEASWGRRHRTSLIIAGVGAGFAIAGIAVGARTKADYFELAKTCPGPCAKSDLARLHREATATNVLLGIAGAVGVASVVTFVVEARSKTPSVAVKADGAGAKVVVLY